jgi:hypothetical protein
VSDLRFDQPRYFRAPVDTSNSEWLFNQAKSQAGQELFVIAMTQGRRNGTWLEIGCGDPIRSSNTYLLEKRLDWSGISIDMERMDRNIVTPFEEYWSGFYNTIRQPHWPEHVVAIDQLPDLDRLQNIPYFRNFIQRQLTDIDSIPFAQRSWQTARPNTNFYQANAVTFDYSAVPARCDYLQVDIHPSLNNLKILELILPDHRFNVITFEHDAWDHSEESALTRSESRCLLEHHGYQMVISDATVPPGHGNGIGDEPINFEDWWVDPATVPESVWRCYQDLVSDGTPKYYYHTLFNFEP